MKTMINLTLMSSSMRAQANMYSRFPCAHVRDVASFVSPSSISHSSSQHFLRHGRRKQKKAYKRYVAKLRAELDDYVDIDDSERDISELSFGHSSESRMTQVKTRFRARVSYCGTPFHGWQLQPGKQTVQGEIEAALTQRFRRRIPVVGAGRTDSGVHARGQAIHFDLFPNEIPFEPPKLPTIQNKTVTVMNDDDNRETISTFCNELENSINRIMSLDIRVFHLQLAPYTLASGRAEEEVHDTDQCNVATVPRIYARPWHVIQSAESKWYSYRLALGATLWNPMERFTRTHFVHRPSFMDSTSKGYNDPYAITPHDIERLRSILKLYEGTHDFGAFGGQLEQNAKKRNGNKPINTIRTVYRVELVREPNYGFGRHEQVDQNCTFIGEEGNFRIDFLLKGALYKMVRNMVGTAIEVWLGRMSEQKLIDLLKIEEDETERFGRKDNPCKPAPPEGLTLECVYYDDGF